MRANLLKLLCYTGLLFLLSCATHKLPLRDIPPFDARSGLDSVFIAHWPVAEEADSLFHIVELPDRSTGNSRDYLSIWKKALREEASRRKLKLIWPETDSLRATPRWPVAPGAQSLILDLKQFELHKYRPAFLGGLAYWMNLSTTKNREYGWLATLVELQSPGGEVLYGDTLLSRRPDYKYTLNRTDRSGLLVTQAAKDLIHVIRREELN